VSTLAEHDHTPAGPPRRLIDRWYDWRDRLLRDQRFQRWAAAFPLTRPVARKRAGELFDLVAGFVYSQILQSAVRLRLFDILAEAPQSVEQLAPRLGLSLEATRRLVAATESLRLTNRRAGDRIGLGDLGAALLGNPGVVAMVEHHAILYRDLTDPVALLRGEIAEPELSRYWAYASTATPDRLGADTVADYSALMAVSQQFIASEILDAYPLDRHTHVMDVGGGEGAFIAAAAARAARPRFTLVDLPAVAARAEARFAAAGLNGRTQAVGGDMFGAPLPTGADLACLIRVIYDHPDHRVLTVLRQIRAALAPGGTLLIAEPMAGTPGAEAVGAAYFGFYLLAMKGGNARSPAQISDLVRAAGFARVEPVRTRSPLFTSLLVARQ
jgi:demethylspheroidene O-methyltransferase